MVFSLLRSCWRYFQSEDYAYEEELPCEEEQEEDASCWVLGEILLFYFVAIALLKMLYHGLEWMHKNQRDVSLTSDCWIKSSKGRKDGSRKGARMEDRGTSFACCCRLGLCGLLRKLFGEPERAVAVSPSSSVSLERRLSKRFSKLSQQTFCDSESSESGSLGSRPVSRRASRMDESRSSSSRKERKMSQVAEVPGRHWTRQQPCLRCKAKRTKEWLIQHFFGEDLCSQKS